MDIHKNARLTLHGREQLAETVIGGMGLSRLRRLHVTPKTAAKWVAAIARRSPGLLDRSPSASQSRPLRLPRRGW